MTTRRPLRFSLAVALIATLGFGLAGCISIKSETATQSAPGIVTLGGVMCVSDYDANTYPDCQASNVAELDRVLPCNLFCFADGDDNTAAVNGQMLVAFRVPNGTVAPTSFPSDAGDTTFNFNQGYTDALTALYTAVPGEHWVGYLSGFKTVDPHTKAADRQIAFHAPFALPPQGNGAPISTPFHWRLAVGFRELQDSTESNRPISCADDINHLTACVDSPVNSAPDFPADLQQAVSDFGVLAASPVKAGQGKTATLSFPVRYLDGAGIGSKPFAFAATTNVPGATATPSVSSLSLAGGATPTVTVSVPVPPGTPLGNYTVTLTTTSGSITRSNTGTLSVVDLLAPVIQIGTPGDHAVFTVGQRVAAAYSCAEELNGSGLATCSGPVANGAPIDTSSPGQKTFTVNASDKAGNVASLTRTYTVAALPRRTLNISLSFLYAAGRTSTRFSSLEVKNVPSGSTVAVRCHGHGCPAKSFRKKHAKGSVSLRPYVRKALPKGLELTIKVSKPGFVSMIKTLTIRPSKAPKIVTTCLAPKAKKARRC
jgi:hypothetical protein